MEAWRQNMTMVHGEDAENGDGDGQDEPVFVALFAPDPVGVPVSDPVRVRTKVMVVARVIWLLPDWITVKPGTREVTVRVCERKEPLISICRS